MISSLAVATSGCTGLFYYPSSTMVRTPSDVGIAYEQLSIAHDDEPTLRGWFLPAPGAAKGTVLFLHGNAENISTHFSNIYWLPKQGYQVFIFDYAGYGESEGVVTVDGIHHDIERMVHYTLADSRVDPKNVFLVGQSLGGSMALYTAAQPEFRRDFNALVVEAPFSSYRAIVRDKLSIFWITYPLQWPLSFLVTDQYSPDACISGIEEPVLMLHGSADETVTPDHSKRLCAALGPRCTLHEVPSAVHGEPYFRENVRREIVEFLDKNLKR